MNFPNSLVRMCVAIFAVSLASAGCLDFADMAESVDDMRVIARVGVIAHPEIGSPGAEARLCKALSCFRSRKVDAIVIMGDLTKDGYLNQYRMLSSAWDKVFNDPVKGIDRNPPRRMCILGPNDRKGYRDAFADELGGTVFDEGEFDVNGFRFRVGARRSAQPGKGPVVPEVFAEGKPPLTDEMCFYPREGASVNAGSLSGVVPRAGYAPVERAASASQGILLSAYSGKVVVSRLDFTQSEPVDKAEAARLKSKRVTYAEKVADDWTIPLDGSGAATPLSVKVPRFWDDTRLMVTRGMVKGGTVFKVVWPPVLAKFTGERAFSYEVEAIVGATADCKGNVAKRVYLHSPNYHLSEDRDILPVFCNFYSSEFPSGARVRFAVTPVSSTGVRGQRIVGEECIIP